MAGQMQQARSERAWRLAAEQHGVVARGQLLGLGYSRHAIDERLAKRRLHRVWRGVYAVGRPQLTRHGRWMAAVLACGPEAFLSHSSAAALWQLHETRRAAVDNRGTRQGPVEVSIPLPLTRRHPGITVHRRGGLAADDRRSHHGIAVTSLLQTLIDNALAWSPGQLESAINEADKRDLIDPESLRLALHRRTGRPGVGRLAGTLDRRTFRLTDSELERCFLPLVRGARLPTPRTGSRVNGFKVDFYWPELGLVVETDGLRYHRTPAQQARDRIRDQAHTRAGLTPLRFTHAQIKLSPDEVAGTLATVIDRLANETRCRR